MHELSRRFTKAICLLTETDRTQLEPYLDSLPSVLGGQGGASKLIISRNVAAPTHIDRGLFNLVIGKGKDLVSLHVQLRDDGPMESVKCLLPANAATSSSLYGILLPGLTLQLIDKRFKARNHKGESFMSMPFSLKIRFFLLISINIRILTIFLSSPISSLQSLLVAVVRKEML